MSLSMAITGGLLGISSPPEYLHFRQEDVGLRARSNRASQWKRTTSVVLPVRAAAAGSGAVPLPDSKPTPDASDHFSRLMGSQAPPTLSDLVWPSAGGFLAMAAMGYMDSWLAPRGLSFTLGSFAAVCTLLFAAPKSPVSQKYNVVVSHLGCAAVGVVALAVFGPGWVARAWALAACIAFMQYTGSLHPPAAGLPLIMIDAPKFHQLRWWYVLFPGVVGCLFLFLVQEAVQWLRENWKF
ncbi:hypothetical protein R1flu_017524 [Riccia fluitans]|uniref:HPP transmembrane region domain-containing protein n=1 Tax=Riccia fluitans TaxID=41844 RepID=A0ABD1ZD70_9MARC